MKSSISGTANIERIASDKICSMAKLQVLGIKHFITEDHRETDCDMKLSDTVFRKLLGGL